MAEGWIKIHRSMFEHPVWTCTNAVQKIILMTILGTVNYKPNKWFWKGQEFEIKEGQMITSLDSLAKKCGKGVSIQNIRTALKLFENMNFLTDESTKQGRLISVVNWGIYQAREELANKQANNHLTDDQQTPNKELTANKESKKDKEGKEGKNILAQKFSEFYEAYPRKIAKKDAEKAFVKLKPTDEILKSMIDALDVMKESDGWKDKQYIPYPATWINRRQWEDDLSSYQKTQNNGQGLNSDW